MPLIKLIMLSFSIIAVFKMNVFIRSTFFGFTLLFVSILWSNNHIFSNSNSLFNILIYAVSTKSNEEN